VNVIELCPAIRDRVKVSHPLSASKVNAECEGGNSIVVPLVHAFRQTELRGTVNLAPFFGKVQSTAESSRAANLPIGGVAGRSTQ